LSGGWKIVKQWVQNYKVTSFEGVAAETAGALTLYFQEHFKVPVSTTHTITDLSLVLDLTKRVSNDGMNVSLLWAWVLTIPISILAAIIYYIFSILFCKHS
jgi:PiT family inorganic phosphate transporter